MADLPTVAQAMSRIAGGKPGSDLSAVDAHSYYEVLQGFSNRVIERLVLRFLKDPSPYFPSSGEMYHAACDLTDKQPGPEVAWAYVLKKIQGAEVELPERAEKVYRMMGGKSAMEKEADENIYRSQFYKLYEQLRMAER